jgi:UDP-N-acetyl-D-glucosamine dehydrogenase
MSLAERLRAGEVQVGVLGLGYIGFSTAVFFAREGVRVIGYDVDTSKVEAVRDGRVYLKNIEFWVGFDYSSLVRSELLEATQDLKRLLEAEVVFVCLPTERNGDPYMNILQEQLARAEEFLCEGALLIVESTMTPGTTQSCVVDALKNMGRGDVLVAVAPRRDWFVQAEWSMARIPRVIGGSTSSATEAAARVLSIVCETVIPATSHREAELVKSTENAYRHMDIVLANQLCFAYPDVNMLEVLRLVGTKWNMNVYHPNLGVGGYCIAPASKYVQGGTSNPIPLLREATDFTNSMPHRYAELMRRFKRPLILGIAYRGDLKVHVLSPGLELAQAMIDGDASLLESCRMEEVTISDPMYSSEEVQSLVPRAVPSGVPFPGCMAGHDLIVVAADHSEYVVPKKRLLENLTRPVTVLDPQGVWEHHNLGQEEDVQYIRLGEKNWIENLKG